MKFIRVLLLILTYMFFLKINPDCPAQNFKNKSLFEKYSLVKLFAQSQEDLKKLMQNDITIEHYKGNYSSGIEAVLNQEEIYRLKFTGINYEIIIQDLDSYYSERKNPDFSEMLKSYEILSNDNIDGFSFGSMGGFYTYNEVVQKLDSMRIQYPNLISVKQNLGTTSENRVIWSVKISDNPDINESASEPAIYFDALHHAREPQAMACVMYYMYWLLENYGTNPEATYLLNNREIYFVPVVNPDGYVYNQTTNPNGGGSWRKNRRNNGTCFGVDLNRNYNYGWGLNSGSSSDPCSETYRGPSAGSEPEIQAIKNLMNSIHPKIGFSMHSVAGRYLNPYGYNDTAVSYDIYSEFSSDFAAKNNYTYGTVIEMLDYYSSGTTRDYLHSTGTYCWTPEVGGSSFWPAQSEIIPVANENLYGMKYLSWVGGAFADFLNYKITGNGFVNAGDTLSLQITLKNRGLSQTAKNVSVDITSLYSNALPLNSSVNYDSIQARQFKNNLTNQFKFKITSSAVYMDEMKFMVSVKQEGVETSRDTLRINAGKPVILFSDNGENGISKWVRAGTGVLWDTTFIDPLDGNKNFADSRYGNSKNSSNNTFTLTDTINLTGTVNPRIEFTAKWAEETSADYTRIQISTNFGSSWINLPGRYTITVSGQPSYTGIRHWINEQINLNAYIGQKIKIRFNLVTDAGVPGDGFYFDNFRVVNYKDEGTSVRQISSAIPAEFYLSQNFPNPFNPVTKIRYAIPSDSKYDKINVKLTVYNYLGMELKTLVNENQNPGIYETEFGGENFPSGIYFYSLSVNGNIIETKKMTFLK